MASRLNPYLSFTDNAREAMEFYASALGGTPVFNTFGDYGGADAGIADKIMHGILETPAGFTLMGADTPPGMEHRPVGSDITISLSGDDADELRGYWDKLSDGGTITMPLDKQMWGDVFGMLTDRFGISWMVNISDPS
jgi:PhnB protein